MNRRLISKAISNIDDAFILEAMTPPAATADAPERTNTMKHSRKILRLLLAACLVFALAVSAYATNFLGIRDMLSGATHALPEEAYGYIQQHMQADQLEDWSARITESLSDESKIMVTVTIFGGDKYIVAPTDADPDTLAVNIGIEGNLTLSEYAAQQGKELLFVGASLQDHGVPAGHGSQSFRNVSPSEMTILVKADMWEAASDIICHVYAVDAAWNKMTMELPITLEKAPIEESGTYVPDDPDAIAGITVGNAVVVETPLGTTIRYMETSIDEETSDNLKKVEFDGLVYGEGGLVLEDDGNWWRTVSRCTGTVGDTLTVRYYDWDDQEIGVIKFIKK